MEEEHPQNPSRGICLVLSALPLLVSIASITLCALGYLLSLFFDTPVHKVVALCSIPVLVTSFVYGCFNGMAFRKNRSCRRLTMTGLISTGIALAIGILVLCHRTYR
jgi:hypothetical protein